MDRETRLESCLRRLLNSTELNLDEMEEDTLHLIREARMVIATEQTATLEEIAETLTYVGEQVELVKLTQNLLIERIEDVLKERERPKQVGLFED
jgi:hypothetical protein